MSNFADEGDAQTLAEFCEWLTQKGVLLGADADGAQEMIVRFIRERAANREANYGK